MKNLILGAGPTGLGAAYRLKCGKCHDFDVFERNPYVGGLSASFVDGAGFTWDVGGHVLFSHFETFDRAVDQALAGKFFEHMRECWVRMQNVWVPYPFQNNVRYLPEEALERCLDGLKNLQGEPGKTANFKEWMAAVFGDGIVRYFMEPYNFKVWATPAELMSKDWIAERVSVVDLERIERNIRENRDDVSWGPNNTFKFPLRGGTGSIYSAIAAKVKDRIHLEHHLERVDLKNKQLFFSNGKSALYDNLISTIPLDQFIEKCIDVPETVHMAAGKLVHNGVYVVGIGFKGKRNDSKCWMYFPEENCPFYRVTNFHNYSPNNVPCDGGDSYFSLMCETSFSSYKPVDKDTIIEQTIAGLVNSGMIDEMDRSNIVSRYLIEVPYAYPVPTIDRDDALKVIQAFLESCGVYSRGRFGAWRYEIGNMDHSFMQGVEIVDRLIDGCQEQVFYTA
ncbi:FAD-dependent oxidoreductase [uncultured Desulfuromonas sp.]|uniref:protoporphyrinogen/coproporphyrinogen oxidase n=1 Tax=uncultured Desulfuromonas sp. TaxID=181013 RepID=UPI002AAA7E87|nr:FAD-dependent oxidoreductase [uncultured Desulfuromonas sp.]